MAWRWLVCAPRLAQRQPDTLPLHEHHSGLEQPEPEAAFGTRQIVMFLRACARSFAGNDGFGSKLPSVSVWPLSLDAQSYIRQNWEFVRYAQFKDPVFGFLVTIEKAMQGTI